MNAIATEPAAVATPTGAPLLVVNGIEVIYNHVILVLKGVSLSVPKSGIVAILGGNGAGKTTTLRAVSNLLKGERGEVTKGTIEYNVNMAATILTGLVPLVVYFVSGKLFVRGIAAGAVKG